MRRQSWVLVGLLASATCVEPGHERAEWTAAGVPASAEVHTTLKADASVTLREIEGQLASGIARLDPQAAESEIGRLNRATRGEFQRVEDLDALRCLALALRYARASNGAYDPTLGALAPPSGVGTPTLPAFEIERRLDDAGWRHVAIERDLRAVRLPSSTLELDLGEVGRGCALDWAARVFARPGARAGLLRLGRSIWAWREPPGSEAWRVEVQDPRDPRRSFLTVRMTNRALASAGLPTAEASAAAPRIFGRRSGARVASDVRAALAVADSAADAAALAHVLLAAGSLEAADAVGRTRGAEALLVVDEADGTPFVLASASLEGRIETSADLATETERDLRYLLPPVPR